MAGRELLSPETGLRQDGRRANELRKIRCRLGIFQRADGSAYFEQGNTKVIALVYGPREVTLRSKALHDRAIITCEYSMANFSSTEPKKKSKGDRRATEISMVIRQTFETVLMTQLFPRSQIDIFVQIIQADGGTRCAAINAACLAAIDAGIPMKDFVVACAAGCIANTPILDLNYLEDSGGCADVPIALLPASETVTTLQMDAKLNLDQFEKTLNLAVEGAKKIHAMMAQAVREHTLNQAERRGIQPM